MDESLHRTVESYRRLATSLNRAKTHERLTQAAGIRLDRPDVQILVDLLDADEPRRIGKIAESLQVESPHVTRHVAALERRGLVERVRDPDDGRAWRIALTDEGSTAALACRRAAAQWFEAVLADWPEPERAELARLLEKLADDMSGYLKTQAESTSSAR
ncbi:MarR family winged helix-turn-helix transcriptional regulator [Nonomuraea candida]|uniref:MarR family winged helix-turn-helix transcriptional regulator n=1 Tax=Nonomuraea candida TaxID=359159 RepID=UPI000694D8A1|nr:MarR family transcriptional regulator [Nonomuraea candida]